MSKYKEIEFQLELLKIQLDMGFKLSVFLTVYSILFSLMLTYEFSRSFLGPLLLGLMMILLGQYYMWRDNILSKLKKKYISTRYFNKEQGNV